MNKLLYLPALLVLCVYGCGNREKAEEATPDYFPVLSFLKSQVSHVDTSIYTIIKITRTGQQLDTTYVRREDFRKEAADFLSIPDIGSKKLKRRYTESKIFDDALERVVIGYVPKEREEADILRQDVIIQPDQGNGDQVRTIYLERQFSNDDSTVHKKMIWDVDKRFQVTTIIQKEARPEVVKKVEVQWNGFRSAE